MKDRYESPFSSRYSSEYMLKLFSPDTRYQTWRRLWTALAEEEAEEGLPISKEQIASLRDNIDNIDYDVVSQREKEVRHDVMAHIYAYGKVAPAAAGIIHLGATSCYVTDNADLIIYRDALVYLRNELLKVLKNLADFSEKNKDLPILSFTHYQPAQPATLGKRGVLWMQDLILDVQEIDHLLNEMRFLGCRGTTGTEASFMELFDNDEEKIDRMNDRLAERFGFKECFPVCSQTYPRKIDSLILNVLSGIGQSAYKFANDMRLYQHDAYLEEPFEESQVGSSAMAYKRNPMRSERIASLSRYVMIDALNPAITSATQWFERTLDDSANKRLSVAEGFLTLDGILDLCINVTNGLVVNEKVIDRHIRSELPFMATENIMMDAVKAGGNRQELHESIRKLSMEAGGHVKQDGADNDLLDLIAASDDFDLTREQLNEYMNPADYTGRSTEQVEAYIKNVVEPVLEKNKDLLGVEAVISV